MLLTLQVTAVLMVALAMSMALAHALELPGKLRRDEQSYVAVQTIYYPGFTIGGIGEPLAAIGILILCCFPVITALRFGGFWWRLSRWLPCISCSGSSLSR